MDCSGGLCEMSNNVTSMPSQIRAVHQANLRMHTNLGSGLQQKCGMGVS